MSDKVKLIFSHPAFETGGGIMLEKTVFSPFIPSVGDLVEIYNSTGTVVTRNFKYSDDGIFLESVAIALFPLKL